MKNLIFIGAIFLLGSCTMQRIDFAKRIPAISDKISPPEIFDREKTAELSILKPIDEQELTFDLVYIDTVNVNQKPNVTIERTINHTITFIDEQVKTVTTRRDPTEHNECRCFAKSLIMSGSILAVMGVITVFAWTTLGIAAFIIGMIMLITGVLLKRR